MEVNQKLKTPKSGHKSHRTRKASSHRDTPEGHSINEKPQMKVLPKTPSPRKSKKTLTMVGAAVSSPAVPSSKKKTTKKHKLLADESYGEPHMLNNSVTSQSSKRSRLSDSEYDVDVSITDPSSLHVSPRKPAKKTPKKSPKKKDSVHSLGNQTDVSWEKAVQKARGLPDGALDDEEEATTSNKQEADKPGKDKDKNKSKKDTKAKFEKGKKKPFDVRITRINYILVLMKSLKLASAFMHTDESMY